MKRSLTATGLAGCEYVVADCETTGVDAKTDRVVEFALVRFRGGRPMQRLHALVDPGVPIPAVASAVHMITDRDVAKMPPLDAYAEDIAAFAGDLPIVAHNATFDMDFLPMLQRERWICSCRLARRLWPAAPRHSNAVLRYHLRIDDDDDLSNIAPHRAESDCIVTGLIFRRELREIEARNIATSLDDVRTVTWSPMEVTHLHAGRKYYGRALSDIPTSYLQWIVGEQSNPRRSVALDADTLQSVEVTIARRLFKGIYDDAPDIAS